MKMHKVHQLIKNFLNQHSKIKTYDDYCQLGFNLAFTILEFPPEAQTMAWEIVAQYFPFQPNVRGPREYITFAASQITGTPEQLERLIQGISEMALSVQNFDGQLHNLKQIKNPDAKTKETIANISKMRENILEALENSNYDSPPALAN